MLRGVHDARYAGVPHGRAVGQFAEPRLGRSAREVCTVPCQTRVQVSTYVLIIIRNSMNFRVISQWLFRSVIPYYVPALQRQSLV